MRKTKLTLLLLAALLAGVCIGFFGYSAIIRARIQRFSRIPGNLPEHITGKLTERLKLDAAQQAQVRAVVQSYDGRLKEARDQSRATLDSLLGQMRDEVATHLTPGQKAEHEKLLQEMDQRHRDSRDLRRALQPPPPGASNAAPAK